MNIWITLATAAISFVMTAILGRWLIPYLHKLKFGQTILDIGPAWHKKKQGTPTMGGIMFIIATVVAFSSAIILQWANGEISFQQVEGLNVFKAISGLLMAVCFGFIGFVDDFVKVRKKQNEGLKPIQKIVMQILVITAYFTAEITAGDTSTIIKFPFLGTVDLWYFYYLVMGLGILYLVNAVNLTDGVDGLCSSVTMVYCIAFVVICSMLGFSSLGFLGIAAAGGCQGFLMWNWHPAKVMMGDTGSMFLGGIVCALGIGAGVEFIMVVCGAVYIWEALSVLIQMTYFKLTKGKRLFKMTPIHHSFEIRGWKEEKICIVFSLLTLTACILGIYLTTGI